MKNIILLSTLFLSLCSCLVTRQSKLVKNDIHLNMSKNQVEAKIGKPFKIESKQIDANQRIDSYIYKESLWTGNEHVTIENILIFENDILKEIKQGEEILDNPVIIKKNE